MPSVADPSGGGAAAAEWHTDGIRKESARLAQRLRRQLEAEVQAEEAARHTSSDASGGGATVWKPNSTSEKNP
jgi:hypothetical protein